jgi:hypothetical protein
MTTLTQREQDILMSFREFIEDSCEHDDRYGEARRMDSEDGSVLATVFEAGDSCWFEVALIPEIPQIRVGFLIENPALTEDFLSSLRESFGSLADVVRGSFAEAGLNWVDAPVEHSREGETPFFVATPWDVEDLYDLENEAVRNRTLRMLEGYVLAFSPVMFDDEDDE